MELTLEDRKKLCKIYLKLFFRDILAEIAAKELSKPEKKLSDRKKIGTISQEEALRLKNEIKNIS